MSTLSAAIRRTRAQIEREEAPVRRALARAYREALDNLSADLDAVTRMIAEARAAGIDVHPDWLRRQSRYRRLMAQAEAEFTRFAGEGLRILDAGHARAVSGGAASAVELMGAAGIEVGFGASVNVPAVERLVSAMQPGSPLRTVLENYGTNAMTVIERELATGVIEGRGSREIVRSIRRGIGGGANRARLEALVRTEMSRAFNSSLDEQYSRMGHVIRGYRWSAAKSARTCLACLAMDGRIFKTYQHRQHVQCRCICTPVAYNSTVVYETGPEWFARQPAHVQRAMMPSGEAFAAYQRGEIGIPDFVAQKRDPVWGQSIRQRSGREALARKRAA